MYMGKVIVPSELCTGGGDLFMKEQHKLKKRQQKQHHMWMRMNHACCCELIHKIKKIKKKLGFYFLFRKCELLLATVNAASASIHQHKNDIRVDGKSLG